MNDKHAPRVFLKDQAYDELKKLILTEHYPQGSFLSERSLAETLGMSKTPVRSAIERLESEGFVSVSPQQGIVVKPLSVSEIMDSFDIRMALESFIVRKITGKLNEEQLSRLEFALEEQQGCIALRNVQVAVETSLNFHVLLAQLHGNEEMLRALWRQRDILYRVKYQIYDHEDYAKRVEQNYLEHAALLRLLKADDGERAARYIEKHIEQTKRLLWLR